MGFLSSPPIGFPEAVAMLNALPEGLLAEIVRANDVIAFLQHEVGFVTDEHELTISRIAPSLAIPINAQSCINALTYIFRSATNAKLSIDNFTSELKNSLLFHEKTVSVLQGVWSSESQALLNAPKTTAPVGELISMDWKLGVSISSSVCKSLNTPYVTLQLRVSESPGQVELRTVEMSLPQFQNFAAQLKDMSGALETA